MKLKIYMLLLAIPMLLMASCKSDDDNNDNNNENNKQENPNENQDPAQEEKVLTKEDTLAIYHQMAVRSVLKRLAGVEDPTGFENKTYEATYGEVRDESRPNVRAVLANTPKQAERIYRGIVGCGALIKETTDGYEADLTKIRLTDDGKTASLGKLTFHTADEGTLNGYVDVEIPQIPNLDRIEFIPADAWGDNASIRSPYTTGDIIHYSGDNHTYPTGYYLCVFPCMSKRIPGILIHFCEKAGTSRDSYNLDGDNEGIWVANHQASAQDITYYLGFIEDEKELKKADIEYLKRSGGNPDEIFPGYYLIGDGLASDTYLNGSDQSIYIMYDSRYTGQTYWGWNVRGFAYFRISGKSDKAALDSYVYVYDSEFNSWMTPSTQFYTPNAFYFYGDEINGATMVYSPDEDGY